MELAAAYLDAAQASLERQEAKKGAGTQASLFLMGFPEEGGDRRGGGLMDG